MFDSQAFAVNNFILDKVCYEYFPTENKKDTITHICFNVNDAFFRQMCVAATSVVENNPGRKFCFHVFCDGAQSLSLTKVKETAAKYGQNFYVYTMDMQPFQAFHLKVARFSRVTYLRIVMPKILKPLTDRYIYMDADMICVGDITQLRDIDLKGYPLAAVSETPESVNFKISFLKMRSGKYFNDGIMLVDIAKWEELQITEQVFAYQGADPKRFTGQSQDLLNLVLDGEILFIERKFNQFADKPIPADTLIYHFLGRDKPWDMVVCEADKVWRHYLELSVWENLTDPMPPKKPQYYHNYKRLMKLDLDRGSYLSAALDAIWYAILKVAYCASGKK